MGKKNKDKRKNKQDKKPKNKKVKVSIESEKERDVKEEETVQAECENTTNSDSPIEKLLKVIAFLGGGGVVAPLLQQLVESIIQTSYQNKCADFYNIPYRYFSIDVGREIVAMLVTILLFVLVFGCGYFLKVDEQKDKLIKIYYRIVELCLALTFSYIVFIAFVALLKYVEIRNLSLPMCVVQIINEHTYAVIGILVVVAIVAVLGLNHTNWLKKIRNELFKNIVMAIISGAVVISSTIFLTAQVLHAKSDVNNKYKYETVRIQESDYAILSEVDGKFLIAKYYVDDDKQPYIFTNTYQLIANEDLLIDYEEWELVPIVETKKSIDEYIKE